ncbi:MAG: DAK2 domain-containing protein [Ruminococcus sp.]|nr:DAK2 domain-containing protein [Ruminococcus sp.]
MNTKKLYGKVYLKMLLGGAAMLGEKVEELNALNVFPVADGDTGTNMQRTMQGGFLEATSEETDSIGKVSKKFAKGILLSARGNSGVILSQIFTGINEILKYFDKATPQQLAEAYRKGVEKAYGAVQNPTEGTILTVFRESTEYAAQNISADSSVEDFFELHIAEARRSLERTKELLPVLAEADVVDSGAAGYLAVAEGMYKALTGELLPEEFKPTADTNAPVVDIDSFTRDSVLEFGYCTEFLLRLTTAKVDPDTFDIQTVIDDLSDLGGESVVAYKQDDIVKVHVHTFTPGAILAKMQEYGEFLTVKIENMSIGHSESEKQKEKEKQKKRKKFSVVSVSTGDGLSALFTDMGVDRVICGGQTMNPSTEEFLEAFSECNSEHIIVLPNNKNIILAAKQAASLYTHAQVHVVETKNIPEGYCALAVINPGFTDMQVLTESALRAVKDVKSYEITRAVRDATIDGTEVKKGDYMALGSGKVQSTADTAEDAVLRALEINDTDLCEIITVFTGINVKPEKRVALTEALEEIYDECEVVVYEGQQEVYDYYIAVE